MICCKIGNLRSHLDHDAGQVMHELVDGDRQETPSHVQASVSISSRDYNVSSDSTALEGVAWRRHSCTC
jgi:hypothetical protein